MIDYLIRVYVFFFARSRFEKFNKLLHRVSLSGLGVLNYKTSTVSGEKAFIESYLHNKSGVVIDVGANVGGYSKDVIRVNSSLTVFAFEPHPVTFSKLSESMSSFENVVTVNKGMSYELGMLKLFDYSDNDGSQHASLYQNVMKDIHGAGSVTEHQVEVITLDEFLSSEKVEEVTLLKIDTEGNELEVLHGAKKAIEQKKIKAIHFEFNEMNTISKAFFRDFWKLLDNYRFYRLLPNEMMEIKKYSPLNCEIFAYQNIVAILED
ncbi:FkbM family methyltransferase [Endozoicomonas ascidiicola]|uniref:FkbM family methyltransferase n=1 Tax=Endozoicomonas ascidiicola TaxID=1698521 RepID=UPI000836B340|nr:FkbM family methyltransferase [Endozoicomonas ascidiicola]